jgi:hypothetical protein
VGGIDKRRLDRWAARLLDYSGPLDHWTTRLLDCWTAGPLGLLGCSLQYSVQYVHRKLLRGIQKVPCGKRTDTEGHWVRRS